MTFFGNFETTTTDTGLYLPCKDIIVKDPVKCNPMRHPFTEYVWSFALKIYMIVVLSSCHLPTIPAGNPTDQELVAGDRGGDQVSSKVVNDPAVYLRYNFKNESAPDADPRHEFVADLSTKWECMIFMTVMTIVCVISCVDIIIGREILFHPYC